jgi:hypothetical protein
VPNERATVVSACGQKAVSRTASGEGFVVRVISVVFVTGTRVWPRRLAVILTDHARVLPGVSYGVFASPVVIRRERSEDHSEGHD